jgi:hypothetical protein
MRTRIVIALAAALCVAAPLASAALAAPGRTSEAHALIGRVLEAYGGWARLDKVRAYRAEGKLFSLQRHHDVPTVRVFQRPDHLKVLIAYPEGHEARLYDGRGVWRARGGAFEAATGPMADATVLQAARAAVPWILKERAADARMAEPLDHHGVALTGVEIDLGRGLVLRAYIDPKTHHPIMSQGLLTHGGMQTHFETWYADWRPVDGVQFAFKEENWASGAHTGTTTLEKLTLDPKLAADEFVAPKGPAPPEKGD